MSRFINEFVRVAILFLMSAVLLSGCSSSSDSSTLPKDNNAVNGIDSNAIADQGEVEANGISIDGGSNNVSESSDDIIADEVVDQPANGATSDVPDPMVQNSTDVTFEITVPAYQSNELQLRLSWGEFKTSLNWVGDELWTINAILPTNTERLLSIVFFDENGGIELGSFEQQYRTGINAAEVFQVNADQFDIDRWDHDGDGVSNLDELIVGTDPRVNEESLLPIIDNQKMSLLFIANYFENLLPNERPYMGVEDDSVSEFAGTITTTDIDANGNGSMSIVTLPHRERNVRSGERLVLENSVQWSGSWGFTDDYYLRQSFDSEVSVDGDMRRLVETGNGSWVGTYSHRWETTVDVTGQKIEGSGFCKVATGTITESYVNNQDTYDVSDTTTTLLTITRTSVDDFWHVSKVYELEGESFTEEYFARELSMHMIRFGYQQQVSENDYFFCDFVDL